MNERTFWRLVWKCYSRWADRSAYRCSRTEHARFRARRSSYMRRIRLTTTEQAQREQIFKTTHDRQLRDRCQAVVRAHRGRKRKTIASD